MHPLAREMHWVDTRSEGLGFEEEVVAHHSPFTQASQATGLHLSTPTAHTVGRRLLAV